MKDAFAAGITSNPTQANVLRAERRALRDATEQAADIIAAQDYIGLTAPADLTVEGFQAAIATVLASLSEMAWLGPRGVRALRDRLRELLVHADTPPGVKGIIQSIKRRYKISQTGGVAAYDQEATDPIEAEAAAALVVLAASDSTKEEIQAAADTVALYAELTPTE